MESELITLISQFGFPIAVAAFVLIRMETTVKKNTEALQELKVVVSLHTEASKEKK